MIFHYCSGEVIMAGDLIIDDLGQSGRVERIILPQSDEAKEISAPEGSVLTISINDGQEYRRLWMPPDGEYWEDLKFIKRAGQKGSNEPKRSSRE
jgi:hypothetical protein